MKKVSNEAALSSWILLKEGTKCTTKDFDSDGITYKKLYIAIDCKKVNSSLNSTDLKPTLYRALLFLSLAIACSNLTSCTKDSDSLSNEDSQTSNNESTQESIIDELDDMATSILNNSTMSGAAGGHIINVDDRFGCDNTTIDFSSVGADKTWGTATITFPVNGCTDKKGNVRKGSIVISWKGGKWFNPGSTHTVTMKDYSINDVVVVGSQKVTCTAYKANPLSVTWTINADHTSLWPDGSTAKRILNKTRKWDHTPSEDTYTVSNGPSSMISSEGTNRHGKVYKVYITTPLVYLGSCAKSNKVFIPVKGEKVVTRVSTSGITKSFTINYGDGNCDNAYTVTSGAITKTLTAKNDSSND